MIFGRTPLAEAEGAILAHATDAGGRRLKKGTRLGRDDLEALRESGIESVVAARLLPGDVTEDEAARRLGEALGAPNVDVGPAATGRVNVFARVAGLFCPDKALIDRLNSVDPSMTLATLSEFSPVRAGQMVATVKIIPLAVEGNKLAEALKILSRSEALKLAPFRPHRVRLIQTTLPTVKDKVLDKTRRVSEARLDVSHSTIIGERRVPHEAGTLEKALREAGDADLVLVFGASAVIDEGDVIPDAIRRAGGTVEAFGMPVDPGNLLLLGRLDGRPVLGAPGCARSPKENGFDFVLNRLLAGLPVGAETLRGMGVGGLLEEIGSPPPPRDSESSGGEPVVDIVVLAAGRSSRMEGGNKLLADFGGMPLVRRSVETALQARRRGAVRVVTGHMHEAVETALEGLKVETIHNPDFAQGLSTSLKAGMRASEDADGVLVMLADQPFLQPDHLDVLISAFVTEGKGSIVAAADRGRRRNPVILSSDLLPAIMALEGDIGAAPIIAAEPERLVEVEMGEAASFDVDTLSLLDLARTRLAQTG